MIGTILGIFGILITIGFGILSVVIYKKSRKNVNLEFENKECYSLFRDDVNRLNIELSYNKKPITSTLILLKARLRNNGQVDIDKNRIYNPLKVISNSDFRWLEATITSKPKGASASVEILNRQEIQINWDLLKKDEFIEIEALSETTDNKMKGEEMSVNFYNSLKFDYRITDLSLIHKEEQVLSKMISYNSLMKSVAWTGVITIVVGCILLFFNILYKYSILPETQEVAYILEKDSTEISGHISSDKPNQIKIKKLKSEDEESITVSEFNSKYKLNGIDSTAPDSKKSRSYGVTGITYIIMGSLLFFLQLLLKRKMKKSR